MPFNLLKDHLFRVIYGYFFCCQFVNKIGIPVSLRFYVKSLLFSDYGVLRCHVIYSKGLLIKTCVPDGNTVSSVNPRLLSMSAICDEDEKHLASSGCLAKRWRKSDRNCEAIPSPRNFAPTPKAFISRNKNPFGAACVWNQI